MMRRESQTMSLCEVQDVLSARSQKVFIGLMKSDLRCRQCTFYAVCLYEQKLSMFCVDTLWFLAMVKSHSWVEAMCMLVV